MNMLEMLRQLKLNDQILEKMIKEFGEVNANGNDNR